MTRKAPDNFLNRSSRQTVKEMVKFLKDKQDALEGFWEGRVGLSEEQRMALVEKLRELAAWAAGWGDRLEKPLSPESRMQVVRVVEEYIKEDPHGRLEDTGGVDNDVVVACRLLTIYERKGWPQERTETEWRTVAEFALSHGIDLVEEPVS